MTAYVESRECCSQRCLAYFSLVEVENITQMFDRMDRRQRRQYLLDCYATTTTSLQATWKNAMNNIAVSSVQRRKKSDMHKHLMLDIKVK